MTSTTSTPCSAPNPFVHRAVEGSATREPASAGLDYGRNYG